MSHRFLCLQGHLWAYDEDPARSARALFCPTCGLRLHPEAELPQASLPRLLPVHDVVTPMFSHGSVAARSAPVGDVSVAARASDIEEIPGYELLGILGKGGMGIVYRARQLSLKRQVAIKMILTGRRARPEERARFQREAEAVARLQHPNIVQIYEIGEQNGLPYFSMEFVNAGSLAQFSDGIPQAPMSAAEFVLILARGMNYAHKRGVVHRDLKPGNILLQLDDQLLKKGQNADTAVLRTLSSYLPKISDFGLALHAGDEGTARVGALIGTPSYMAPEQARGVGEVGPAADVYALGAILYEMLAGRPPFRGTTPEETALQVITQEPVPPAQLQPKIPPDLETICLACLEKTPTDRYASAEDLAEDLRRFLAGEPILAQAGRLPDRVRTWARRHPVTMAVLLILSLVAVFLAWDWHYLTMDLRADLGQTFQARHRAETELRRTEDVVDAMTALARRPAAAGNEAKLQREILECARRFYEERLKAPDALPAHPFALAQTHIRLAEVCDDLNDRAAAQKSYARAAQLLRRLSDAEPGNVEYHQLLQVAQRLER